MRLAIIIPSLNIGGAEIAAIRLANVLARRVKDVTLIVLLENNTIGRGTLSEVISANVALVYLNSSSMLQAIPRLRRVLKERKFDVIQSMIRGANIVALLASLGVKNHAIVLREANIILFPNVSLFQKVCVILMLNLLYRLGDAVVCNCSSATEILNKILISYKKPLFTLANPVVEKSTFGASFLANIHNKRSRKTFLCVSRHNEQKDIIILLKAFRELLKTHPQSHLTIIGDGPLFGANLAAAEKLGIHEETLFLRHFSPLSEMYLKCETFVLPSMWEGTPNAMVEALSFGMKVVSFDALGCAPKLARLGDGDVVKERDPEALMKALVCASNREYPNQNLRLDKLRQFELSNASDKFFEAYEEILCG